MKKIALTMSLLATAMFAGEWSGTLSDSKCGAAHADGSEKSMKCAQACVNSGKAEPVLVSDGKVYKLKNADEAKQHVGHQVTVTGSMEDDTITVQTVKMKGS